MQGPKKAINSDYREPEEGVGPKTRQGSDRSLADLPVIVIRLRVTILVNIAGSTKGIAEREEGRN